MTQEAGTGLAPQQHRPITRLDVDALLDDPAVRVVVCCGSGGVGKTTTAAALALRGAERGRTVVVLTIDPARRLAQSMGLSDLDNEPRAVPGAGNATGSLDAMMLDMKRTFDEIVLAHAEPAKAREILDNPFYQSLSSSFAGTQEYMAMEKLGQLRRQQRWDLIVVDTPPSRSALDFLDAPQRLGAFLDSRFLRMLMAPARTTGRGAARMMGASVSWASRVLDRVVPSQVLHDIAVILAAFESMFGGFRERATATYEMLQAPDTRFLVVAAPEQEALREAGFFVRRLQAEGMPLGGLVVNRVPDPKVPWLSVETALAASTRLPEDRPVGTAVLRIHAEVLMAHERALRLVDGFLGVHPDVRIAMVPAFAQDVHDLGDLRAVGAALGGA